MAGSGFTIGDWCWFTPAGIALPRDRAAGHVGREVVYRVWLPAKDAVVRVRAVDLAALESVRPSM